MRSDWTSESFITGCLNSNDNFFLFYFLSKFPIFGSKSFVKVVNSLKWNWGGGGRNVENGVKIDKEAMFLAKQIVSSVQKGLWYGEMVEGENTN
jgi:hypothetical protein